MGVTNIGLLTLTSVGEIPIFFEDLHMRADTPAQTWTFTATNQGQLVATFVGTVNSRAVMPYVALQASNGSFWKLQISRSGQLTSTLSNVALEEFIPYEMNVTMSAFPVSDGVICMRCGNATVHVSGDFSCWCCSCNSFVPDEETNIYEVLDI